MAVSHSLNSQRGMTKLLSLTVLLFLMGAAGYFIFFVLFGYTVPPGYFGVRQVKFGPAQGYSEKGLTPGKHWGDPLEIYSTVHLIPQTVQMVHFQREPDGVQAGEGGWTELPPLEIQSADRATIDLDISVVFQFYSFSFSGQGSGKDPQFHGGPAELLSKIGVTRDAWQNTIRKVADDEVKRASSKVLAGDFYKPEKREPLFDEALGRMNEGLRQYGIKVVALLPRRIVYREERIDQAIFLKNLQEQEEQLNEAGSKLAEVQADLEQVAAKLDANIETLRVKGQNESRVIRSQGDLYENEKKAQGDLAVAKARAEVDTLRAQAFADAESADIYVARELAPLLGSIKGGIVSNLDPYDVHDWMERLGADTHKGGGAE